MHASMKRSSFDIHLISFIFSIIGKAISAVLLSETCNFTITITHSKTKLLKKNEVHISFHRFFH